jgi:hypothetical protein
MNTLLFLDEASGDEVQRCHGPASNGSCPRVSIGDILPCAGYALRPADAGAAQRFYSVSAQATLCPVTIAAALAVIPDTLLMLDE